MTALTVTVAVVGAAWIALCLFVIRFIRVATSSGQRIHHLDDAPALNQADARAQEVAYARRNGAIAFPDRRKT